MGECIFCKIARKEIPVEIVYESENFLAFPDAHPVLKGHTLIIPKKHSVNLIDMSDALGNELLSVIKQVAEIGFKQGAEGFNVIANTGEVAGQVVMHTHIHFLPRKKGEKATREFKTI